MTTRPQLRCEALEDRCVPAIFGNTWADAEHLSFSFAPDGTQVGDQTSNLFATLNQSMTTAQWQGEILRAFQTWAAVTNVNFHVNFDDGSKFGTMWAIQGAPRFGDIRISARPLSDNVLVVSNPFDLMNTWSGEIIINSNKVFDNDRSANSYDLYTVMLQEVGHVLGLGSSEDPNSVMFGSYRGVRTGLSEGDILNIQALYGVRERDSYDLARSNETTKNATDLAYLVGSGTSSNSVKNLIAFGSITTIADVDTYKFTTPASLFSTPMIRFNAGGYSLLKAKVELLNSSGKVMLSGETNAYGYLNLSSSLSPNTSYFIRVSANATDSFGVGSYRLAVGDLLTTLLTEDYSTRFETPTGIVASSILDLDGKDTNNTTSTAVALGSVRDRADARWDFTGISKLDRATDQDYYKIRTNSQTPSTMIVAVWTPGLTEITPKVQILNDQGKVILSKQLMKTSHSQILQLENVQAKKDYYVVVSADYFPLLNLDLRYQLAVDFRDTPIEMTTIAQGQLTDQSNEITRSLQVNRSTNFRFELSNIAPTNPQTVLRLAIFDSAGKLVAGMDVAPGETRARDFFLQPGLYRVQLFSYTNDGSALGKTGYELRYNTGSDPIGPEQVDPVGGGGSDGSTSGDPYYWDPYQQESYHEFYAYQDPYTAYYW